MASLPTLNVSECDPNSPLLTKSTSDSSVFRRAPSIKPSMRSSRSRLTIVGYDESLELKTDVEYRIASSVNDYSWLDHISAVFCMPRRPKSEAAQTVVPQRLPTYQDREINVASPWVLPVYVLSTERDEHRHLIPREAKCTIDTGNLQGNIVSRAFAVDVLGYTEQDFHNLTNDEVEGGAGVTGHKLIPDGAIYLTWYHSNSTRVFRDMRFLISEHPMYDLIIGARSIQKNRILDVPNLMTTGAIRWNSILDQAEKADKERLRMLESKVIKLDEAYDEWKLTATNDQKMRFSEKKNKEVEDEKDILKDAIQAEYRNQIRKEEKRRSAPTTKSAKLRQEYKDEYEVTLDFPLPAEKIA